jgi:hypothetical protein
MPTTLTHLSTQTAADLLAYETFHHVSKSTDRLTRVASKDQEWIVQDWDGEIYYIKFEKNFSKKHLFTFSKDVEKTKFESQQQAAKPGQRTDSENWHNAEMELLKNKIDKNLQKRSVACICQCGQLYNSHLRGGACGNFRTPYKEARTYVGKPTPDPIAGAKTIKNTCIILNWIPKSEFEQVVVQSIQAHEKPQGWTKGQPLAVQAAPLGSTPQAVAAATKTLRWDFTQARRGAIIFADRTNPPTTFTDYRGCEVQAKKTGSAVGKQTWEVFHMNNNMF